MKRARSGMVLLELLVAIAVVSLLTVAGFRAFGSLGELLHRRNLAIMESARITGLETDLKRAWDQRLAHRFQSGPWLVIEGVAGGNADWLALRRLRLRTVGTDGEVSWWELAGSSRGRIDVNAEAAGEWLPGTAPVQIRLRFPEARSRQNQTGLTLRGDWR